MDKKEIGWYIDRDVSVEIIKQVEKLWNISFPRQYIDIVSKHDGSSPGVLLSDGSCKYGSIKINGWHGKNTGFRFLKYSNSEEINKTRVVATYKTFKECLPEQDKIFPFADDGAGNLFFFDYRRNPAEPTIAFLDHERAVTVEDLADEDLDKKPLGEWLNNNLYPVCNSFSELLDLINPIEE